MEFLDLARASCVSRYVVAEGWGQPTRDLNQLAMPTAGDVHAKRLVMGHSIAQVIEFGDVPVDHLPACPRRKGVVEVRNPQALLVGCLGEVPPEAECELGYYVTRGWPDWSDASRTASSLVSAAHFESLGFGRGGECGDDLLPGPGVAVDLGAVVGRRHLRRKQRVGIEYPVRRVGWTIIGDSPVVGVAQSDLKVGKVVHERRGQPSVPLVEFECTGPVSPGAR